MQTRGARVWRAIEVWREMHCTLRKEWRGNCLVDELLPTVSAGFCLDRLGQSMPVIQWVDLTDYWPPARCHGCRLCCRLRRTRRRLGGFCRRLCSCWCRRLGGASSAVALQDAELVRVVGPFSQKNLARVLSKGGMGWGGHYHKSGRTLFVGRARHALGAQTLPALCPAPQPGRLEISNSSQHNTRISAAALTSTPRRIQRA